MPLQDTLVSWAAVLGSILSLIGLIQSRAWLTALSALSFGAALALTLYARNERLILSAAAVKIEGRSIDSLNAANLTRHIDRTLVVQDVQHVARIEGEDLKITWHYSGYCRAPQATAMEFSVDTDNNVPFEELVCFAYDLRHDPRRKHKIRPLLLGADGISKKITIPFLESLTAEEPFSVILHCELPGCMKTGWSPLRNHTGGPFLPAKMAPFFAAIDNWVSISLVDDPAA